MQLANFTQSNQDPLRPAGPCEVGGRAAHCFFDRSDPDGAAMVTVRFDMTPRAPLPQFARDRTSLEIAGAQVPVRAAELECGAEALQGSLDPSLIEAVAGPAAPPDPPADSPAESLPADLPAGASPPADGDDGDELVALSREHAAAKRERREHADRVKGLRADLADLRGRIDGIQSELETAAETAAGHADRCAGLRRKIRDLVDREEV